MTEQPTCQTCARWRPDHKSYPACAKRNRRPGWGDLELMPAGADEWCVQHEEMNNDR